MSDLTAVAIVCGAGGLVIGFALSRIEFYLATLLSMYHGDDDGQTPTGTA